METYQREKFIDTSTEGNEDELGEADDERIESGIEREE